MSPYNKDYDFFVYGTLPLFIVRVVAEVAQEVQQGRPAVERGARQPAHLTGYDGVHLVGRALSGSSIWPASS